MSALEVLDAAIERAEQANCLGAIVTQSYELARKKAVNVSGALAGVPTFIKDLTQVRGVMTGWGARGAGQYVSPRSDPFAILLESTGLVSLGKSATPELGLTATTEPLGQPPCRNPWDPSRSAGGSSGGAACLVAAGVVPLAHGSDGGGSIRIPSACCGLVGLKPSRFRLDMEGSHLLPINIATHGVLSRTVRDALAFHEAIEGQHRPRRVKPIWRTLTKPGPLKIGVFVDSPTGSAVHPETRDAVLAGARVCASLGHEVEEIPCPFEGRVLDDFLRYWGLVAWIQKRTARLLIHRRFDTRQLEPWSQGIAGTFTDEPAAALQSMRRLRHFAHTYASVMKSYDVSDLSDDRRTRTRARVHRARCRIRSRVRTAAKLRAVHPHPERVRSALHFTTRRTELERDADWSPVRSCPRQ